MNKRKLKYIIGNGEAEILESQEDVEKTFGFVLQKFPYLKDLPGEPEDFCGVRVKLNEVKLNDNTTGFANTKVIEY